MHNRHWSDEYVTSSLKLFYIHLPKNQNRTVSPVTMNKNVHSYNTSNTQKWIEIREEAF